MPALQLPTTPRQKIILSMSLTALITAGLIAFITWPSMREIKRLNSEIDTQRLELEALYQKGQSLKETLKAYAEVKPTIGTLSRVYVQRGGELAFITSLEAVADTAKVDQQIKLNSTPANQPVNELPIQLDVKTDLTHLISYLGGLEGLDYYVNINTVRLGTPGRAQANGTLTALLLATTYLTP